MGTQHPATARSLVLLGISPAGFRPQNGSSSNPVGSTLNLSEGSVGSKAGLASCKSNLTGQAGGDILRVSQGAVSAHQNYDPEKSGFILLWHAFPSYRFQFSCRFALFAGTPIAQKLPGINSQFMAVVPMEFDGVFAYAFGGIRFGCGLEHREGAGCEFGRFAGFAASLATLLIAQGARAGVTQVREIVVRAVAILPFDVHTRARADVHLHRFRVSRRHKFSIA